MKFRILKNKCGGYKLQGRNWWWPFWSDAYLWKNDRFNCEADYSGRLTLIRHLGIYSSTKQVVDTEAERIRLVIRKHIALTKRDQDMDTWIIEKDD